jgi:hypothetical protein
MFSVNILFNISNAHVGVVTTEIRTIVVQDVIPLTLAHVPADAKKILLHRTCYYAYILL